MAGFYVSVEKQDMAGQVAKMINDHNRWYTTFSAFSILQSAANYFVELEGSRVVGCAASMQDYENLSKIQHICVLPSHRGRGLAKHLTESAICSSKTEYVYMTIREDNIPSLKLSEALNFKYVKRHWFRDHWTLTFGRRRDDG